MVISKKTIIFQGFRGGPTFSRVGGGSNFFQGGGVSNFFQGGGFQMLISIETHITPLSWIRTCPHAPSDR